MKLYGIDYDTYITGGIGNQKMAHSDTITNLFYEEEKMLLAVVKLKKSYGVGNIKPFITFIEDEDKKEYKL